MFEKVCCSYIAASIALATHVVELYLQTMDDLIFLINPLPPPLHPPKSTVTSLSLQSSDGTQKIILWHDL